MLKKSVQVVLLASVFGVLSRPDAPDVSEWERVRRVVPFCSSVLECKNYCNDVKTTNWMRARVFPPPQPSVPPDAGAPRSDFKQFCQLTWPPVRVVFLLCTTLTVRRTVPSRRPYGLKYWVCGLRRGRPRASLTERRSPEIPSPAGNAGSPEGGDLGGGARR